MKTQISDSKISYQVAVSAKQIKEAKQLCHDVYLQMGYINESYPDKVIPYEFENAAIYIVALNEYEEVIGTMRMTGGPYFKTLECWKDSFLPGAIPFILKAVKSNMYEIGALAVRKDHSAMKISWGLYKTGFQICQLLSIKNIIISMDYRALRSLEMLGWKVVKIGGPKNYFGSLTVPGILPIEEQAVAVRSKNQTYNNYLAA